MMIYSAIPKGGFPSNWSSGTKTSAGARTGTGTVSAKASQILGGWSSGERDRSK